MVGKRTETAEEVKLRRGKGKEEKQAKDESERARKRDVAARSRSAAAAPTVSASGPSPTASDADDAPPLSPRSRQRQRKHLQQRARRGVSLLPSIAVPADETKTYSNKCLHKYDNYQGSMRPNTQVLRPLQESGEMSQLLNESKSLETLLADVAAKARQMLDLLPWKQECAIDRLKSDYKKIYQKLEEIESSTAVNLNREVDSHKEMVNSIQQLLRQRMAELNACTAALQSGNAQSVQDAYRKLQSLKAECSQQPTAINAMVESLQSLELTGGAALTQLEQLLSVPSLHYIKLSSLSPADVLLSLTSERNVVGQPVQLEIRPSKLDARFADYLSALVHDSEASVVAHKLSAPLPTATSTNSQLLQFVPTLVGRYRVTVKLYGEHVGGSPLTALVSAGGVSRLLAGACNSFSAESGDGQRHGASGCRRAGAALQAAMAAARAADGSSSNVAKQIAQTLPWQIAPAPSPPIEPPTDSGQPEVAVNEGVLLPGLPAPPPPPRNQMLSDPHETVPGDVAELFGAMRLPGVRRGVAAGVSTRGRGILPARVPPPPPSRSRAGAEASQHQAPVVAIENEDWDTPRPTANAGHRVVPTIAQRAPERVAYATVNGSTTASARVNLCDLLCGGRGVSGRHLGTLGMVCVTEPADVRLSGPIGCAKSEQHGAWVICDTHHNMVKLFSASLSPLLTVPSDFRRPSAVAVLPGGRQFAIKDVNTVRVFDFEMGKCVTTFDRVHLPYGLAYDHDGTDLFCTVIDGNCGARAEVAFLDGRSPCDGPVRRHPYPLLARLDGAAAEQSKPRFLDCRGGVLAISDLGVNRVAVAQTRDGASVGVMGGYGRRPGEFTYASGVSIDGAGNFLVGDSRANRVQLFDASGHFKCVLVLPPPSAPLSSDIHLTDDGQLMVTCLKASIAPLFQLTSA